jgi:NADH-quinone oxidoreductase subunit L
MVFLVLRPAAIEPPHHPHAPGLAMNLPIALLSLGALGAGFLGAPVAALLQGEPPHLDLAAAAPALAATGLGLLLAWLDFGRAGAPRAGLAERVPAVRGLLAEGFYVDRIYDRAFVRPALAVARACRFTEVEGLDATGDAVASGTVRGGLATARTQAGPVQLYLATTIATAGLLALYVLLA